MKRFSVCCLALSMFLYVLYGGAARVSALSCNATSAVVIYADTGDIIYSKNCNERLPMASTTKIMTALLLCEFGNLDREIKVTKEMVTVEGSSMGLLPDDIVTLRGLLYGMMLPSGNDAANTTAYVVGGNLEKFADMMNKKAEELGLKDTHFVTPSGLDAEGHYTTAYELALIAAEALKNSEFLAAVSSKSAVLYYGNPPYRRSLTNHNKLLNSYEGLIGVKTGFTKKAGRCLVTAAQREGRRIVAVTLNDGDDWQDHKELLDFGFSNLKTQEVAYKNKSITIPVIGGEEESITLDIPDVSVTSVADKEITLKVFSQDFLYAPVKSGQVVATVCVYCDGKLLKSNDIMANKAVKPLKISKYEEFKNIFSDIFSAL